MQICGEFQWQNYISSIKPESPYEPHCGKVFQCHCYHASTYPLRSSIWQTRKAISFMVLLLWHLLPKNKTFINPTGTNWLTLLYMLRSFKHLTSPLVEVKLTSRIGRFLSGRNSRQYRWYWRGRYTESARCVQKNRCLCWQWNTEYSV
jgi:hypothetical protein